MRERCLEWGIDVVLGQEWYGMETKVVGYIFPAPADNNTESLSCIFLPSSSKS